MAESETYHRGSASKTRRDRPVYRLIFFFVLAPIAAAVIIMALLLFGVEPRLVFSAGHAMKSWLKSVGIDAPNAIGVLTTIFVWWTPIAILGILWERRKGRRGA